MSTSKPTVAIIGASADRAKPSNESIRAHRSRGYEVFPVNPRGGEIDGLAVYPKIADVPSDRLNRVSLYVPPAVALGLLEEIAAKGCDELFFNPGSDSDEAVARARELGLEPIVACSVVNVMRGA